jgi:hypothetical protein
MTRRTRLNDRNAEGASLGAPEGHRAFALNPHICIYPFCFYLYKCCHSDAERSGGGEPALSEVEGNLLFPPHPTLGATVDC